VRNWKPKKRFPPLRKKRASTRHSFFAVATRCHRPRAKSLRLNFEIDYPILGRKRTPKNAEMAALA
jgi:hypothetical protein